MRTSELSIYAVHAAFWGAFGLTRITLRVLDRGRTAEPAGAPVAQQQKTAPYSRALVALHMCAFGLMYFGVGYAAIPGLVPNWFSGQRAVGTAVIAAGGALLVWALLSFRSWRFRAQIEPGHQLATGGPFGLMRHPIYMALNLLALGTAIWVPVPMIWAAFALMVVGGDLRGRAEERVLTESFGDVYKAYCARTRRFLPGIY